MFRASLFSPRGKAAPRRRAVDDLVHSLALIVQPDALRASLCEHIRELLGCDAVVLCLPGTADHVYTGDVAAPAPHRVAFSVSGTLAKWLRANGEALRIPDPRGAFDYLDAEERDALTAIHARVCVPVTSGSRMLGILVLCRRREDWRLAEEDVELLTAIGRQAGLALERAQLHEAERQRLKDLHRADQLAVAGQLAATVAHEIRNPLAAIRSTIQYAVESSAPWPAKQQLLEESLSEVDRIEQTVGKVLALSRPPADEFTLVDLVDVVQQSMLLIQAHAQAQRIAIEREFDIDTLPIVGDAAALHQVCLNLFLNACQAMPDGGRLSLRCTAASDPAPVAVVQVRDTGTGIATEHLARIFDPFFTTKRNGTGLGLPICKDIVSRHGGQLRVDSEPGQGTCATVLIPLR